MTAMALHTFLTSWKTAPTRCAQPEHEASLQAVLRAPRMLLRGVLTTEGGQARAEGGLIRGKEDGGQQYLAVAPFSGTLHLRAESLARMLRKDKAEGRNVARNVPPEKLALRSAEEVACRPVSQETSPLPPVTIMASGLVST